MLDLIALPSILSITPTEPPIDIGLGARTTGESGLLRILSRPRALEVSLHSFYLALVLPGWSLIALMRA